MRKIPVTKPYFTEEEAQMAAEALASGWVAQGPRVAEFEKHIAAHEGVAEGVATTSCTTALHLAMVAEGLEGGMDVIAPAFTFVATENRSTKRPEICFGELFRFMNSVFAVRLTRSTKSLKNMA